MDYNEFTPRKQCFDGFVRQRKRIFESIENGTFGDVFSDLCANAMVGDCVAQDVVAYFFNKGVPNLLSENYDLYMSWEILAGANGNEFALEKLEFFLNPALEPIVYDEEILATAMHNRILDKDNALMVLSNLICEGIVDELRIEPKTLVEFDNKDESYTPRKNRVFLDAMEKAIPKVVKFLMS